MGVPGPHSEACKLVYMIVAYFVLISQFTGIRTHLSINPFIKRAFTCTRARSVSISLSLSLCYTCTHAAQTRAHTHMHTIAATQFWATRACGTSTVNQTHRHPRLSASSTPSPRPAAAAALPSRRQSFLGNGTWQRQGRSVQPQHTEEAQRSQVGYFNGGQRPGRHRLSPTHTSVATAATACGAQQLLG